MKQQPSPSEDALIRFTDLSQAARVIWAKSDPGRGHGLLMHMLDVAAVAERLLARESPATLQWAAASFGLEPASVSRAIAALVGLHDIGKAIAGFQAKWPAGQAADARAGLDFSPAQESQDAHDLASALELERLLAPHAGSAIRAAVLGQAVAAHHGHVFLSTQRRDARRVGEAASWSAARREIFDAYWSTLQPAIASDEAPTFAALAWLAGLTSVSDWIGSNTDWFAPGERADTLAGHHDRALELADLALDAIGWPRYRPLLHTAATTDEIVGRTIGRPTAATRPLQTAADRLLEHIDEPALVIVEAPMGEGKTELALLAHLRLQARLGHRGLYLGLPTQATGNAMFDRTLDFLRAFGHPGGLDIQLAHGGAMLSERLVTLRGVHGETRDAVRSSAWFSQRRRPLLSPYGVGTIDQALLAALNVKHHFVRLWGLSNRVVVLDEVHAYDTYTGTLIESLLRWLKALRCSVVLMSATLPRDKRDALLAAWDAPRRDTGELPYPRLVCVSAGKVRDEHFATREQATVTLAAVDEDLQAIADLAVDLVRGAGCGAVVVNTVDRAQKLHRLLRDRLAGTLTPMLFHARFPGDERSQRERAVLATFGRDAQRPRCALLVATQVVEQSLDIDFDFLVSDLAPVDLLLQRAGQLHRHDRVRPAAHRAPRLVVAGLRGDRPPDLKTTAWGAVYDEWILYRTWALASRESGWRMPEDIDRMVQAVYGAGELPAGLDARTTKLIEGRAQGLHLAETQHERQLARNAVLDVRCDFDDAYAGKPRGSAEGDFPGVRNVTRLGPQSLTVVPVHAEGGLWRVHPQGQAFDPGQPLATDLAHQLVERQVRLSRRDLVQALKQQAQPPAFAEHPWLQHCVALPLSANQCVLGALTVSLDPDLGIVYTSAAEAAPTKDRPS